MLKISHVFSAVGFNTYVTPIGKLNSAIENYHIANEINDPSAFVYHRIASCHKALGNKDLSLLYFKKTILIEPNFEKGWTEIIEFYCQNSDYSNALHYSKKAIESNGDNPFFSNKAGELLMKKGDFSDAIFYFETSINIGYVEIVRAIPLLVLILWIYYGLPIMTGISFSPFVSGIIALSISESAFQAEIFRAGINSIKKSQWEAGSSLGLSFFRKLRLVILPQAIKNILPAIGNQFVYVLKMSSLVSIIGIGDLTRKANELVVTTYRPLEIYTFLIY